MTDPTVVAAAVVVIVGAVSGATIAIMKQQTTSKLQILSAQTASTKEISGLKEKVAVVEHATNSLTTQHLATIAAQEKQLAMYREQISKMEIRDAVSKNNKP